MSGYSEIKYFHESVRNDKIHQNQVLVVVLLPELVVVVSLNHPVTAANVWWIL